jgi:hypothetical protein
MRLFAAFCLLSSFAVVAQPAVSLGTGDSAPVCLGPVDMRTGSIDHTHVVDPQTILFYMRDGRVWKNSLKSPCPSLRFHGFRLRTGQEEVCSNAQSIQVLDTGEVCLLGEFTPFTPPPQSR